MKNYRSKMHRIKSAWTSLKSCAAVAAAALLAACADTSQMGFNATIQNLGDGRVELIATVTNNSGETKTLSDIDIDNELHNKLNLQPLATIDGDYIPIDNTISYTINQELKPSEAYTFRLRGRKSEQFITGDVDFIINNDLFGYRSFPVSCCQ